MGVEPTSSAWKADVLAVVRHPHILWKIFLVPQAENIQNTQSLFFLFILDFSRFSSDTTIRFTGLWAYSCALFCPRYSVDVQTIRSDLTHQGCTSAASLICIEPERTTLTAAGSAMFWRRTHLDDTVHQSRRILPLQRAAHRCRLLSSPIRRFILGLIHCGERNINVP